MKRHNPLITGTIILTATGLLSRFIGFFYRIFLSRNFGAANVGIYQLIAPVLALTFSLTVSGIQTAISKFVAGEPATRDYRSSLEHLFAGLGISLFLSAVATLFIYQGSDFIASQLLLEPRTAPLLRILALSVPLSAIHSCINGYYYGVRETGIPAASQLIEQSLRVGSVYIIYQICISRGYEPTIAFAVLGLVIGECASMLFSLVAIRQRFGNFLIAATPLHFPISSLFSAAKRLFMLAAPLSANRVILNLLQSIEAIYIPNRLMLHGLNNSAALSAYGVLTGMALPLVLFPSAITNSVSVLLLPVVSEADSLLRKDTIQKAVRLSTRFSLVLGVSCTALFLFGGKFLGNMLFENAQVGNYIMTLSFLCPLLYLSSMLNSILNGLGKTGLTFCYSVASLLLRLVFVFFFIPQFGMPGYLWGVLASQLLQTVLCLFAVRSYY